MAAGTMTTRVSTRLRARGRSALSRATRMTGATVAAFLAAETIGLRQPPPLIAALTALLVVQATLASTLVNGVQRVVSVAAGVVLAVLLVSITGLTWWSLGALVAASIVVGQLLRLGPHLVEVPISAMLVLGVGQAAGAESVGWGRVVETIVGAIVGVLVNLAFPPAVSTRHAGHAVAAFADEMAALLSAAAEALEHGSIPDEIARQWMDDARRLNRRVPGIHQALDHAEESRHLNVRALGMPQECGLRSDMEVLEHSSVTIRALFRAIHDATQRRTGVRDDPDYADAVRCATAVLMADMSAVFQAFGRRTGRRLDRTADAEHSELANALQSLRSSRASFENMLIGDPRSRYGLWELNFALLITVDRMILECETANITPDQRRTANALAKFRSAVQHATHRAESEDHPQVTSAKIDHTGATQFSSRRSPHIRSRASKLAAALMNKARLGHRIRRCSRD